MVNVGKVPYMDPIDTIGIGIFDQPFFYRPTCTTKKSSIHVPFNGSYGTQSRKIGVFLVGLFPSSCARNLETLQV